MKMKIAQLQSKVHDDREKSAEEMRRAVLTAAETGADVVTLPEMFACPYAAENFPLYAEEEGGPLWRACSETAKEAHVYLQAGSMPEKDGAGRVYNTAYVFDRAGRRIAKHRKMHLFDINVAGGQVFKESDTLSAGNEVTVFATEFGVMGLCICYDFRFPELARLMTEEGAKVIFVPAAFNMTTGPAHWELMFRSRAVDNQVFAVGTAPARDETAGYTSWGHSLAVSPWGEVIGQLDEGEGRLVTEFDLDRVEQVREQLPLLRHRRKDLYTLHKIP